MYLMLLVIHRVVVISQTNISEKVQTLHFVEIKYLSTVKHKVEHIEHKHELNDFELEQYKRDVYTNVMYSECISLLFLLFASFS